LKFLDEEMQEQELIVDETYKLDKESGDLEVRWEWIPEIWEGTKVADDVYLNIRAKPNQFKDLDDLYSCKLGYTGIAYNNLNSAPVSMIDRMKPYQYLYNIIMYRLELDLANDKGKKFLVDINQIPTSMGVDMKTWMYYMDAMGIAFINPNEEGARNKPSNFNQWQAIDLSQAQAIQQKIGLLEYLEQQCSEVSGVTKQREGQVGPNELVGNTQQAVVQSSHITEDWFYAHNQLKGNVLESLIDTAKVAWGESEPKKLQYILDDMTLQVLKVDPVMLTESSFGLFTSDSAKDQELFMTMKQLAHAALQNQTAELSDIVKMLTSESSGEIRTLLEKAEDTRKARESEMAQQGQQAQMAKIEADNKLAKDKMELEKYKIDEDNATKIEVAEINSFKNQMDQDINDNNVPDQLEIDKLRVQEEQAKRKLDQEDKKIDLKKDEIKAKKDEATKARAHERAEKAKDRASQRSKKPSEGKK